MSVTTMAAPTTDVAEEKGKGKSKKLKLIIVLVLVLALAGAGWFLFLRPSGGEKGPVPGLVVALEPVQVNLSAGHYLRIGIALQLVEGVTEVDGSKALDGVIDTFSGRSTGEINRANGRQKLKKELMHLLDERYEGEVMGVYFTEFVTQ